MGRKAGIKGIDFDHENRNQWAAELWPHFKTKGLKGFNMDEVARTLDKSKATVYKYFQTRGDILELILSQILGELVEFESALANKDRGYVDRYKDAIEILSSSIGGISTTFLLDLKKYHPNIWESIDEFKNFAIGVLGEFYKEGKDRGHLGETPVELLVIGDEIFLGAILDPEYLHKKNISLEEGLRAYFENKMFGMLVR